MPTYTCPALVGTVQARDPKEAARCIVQMLAPNGADSILFSSSSADYSVYYDDDRGWLFARDGEDDYVPLYVDGGPEPNRSRPRDMPDGGRYRRATRSQECGRGGESHSTRRERCPREAPELIPIHGGGFTRGGERYRALGDANFLERDQWRNYWYVVDAMVDTGCCRVYIKILPMVFLGDRGPRNNEDFAWGRFVEDVEWVPSEQWQTRPRGYALNYSFRRNRRSGRPSGGDRP